MAEVSRGQNVFGRLLTAAGLVWVFWAFFGEVIELELGRRLVSLPVFPGIVLLFIGRAIARGARRGEIETRQRPSTSQTDTRPEPRRSRPSPAPAKRPETRVELEPAAPPPVTPEPAERSGRAPSPEVMIGSLGRSGDGSSDAEKTPVRKTSAEMVAEARARYGKRS